MNISNIASGLTLALILSLIVIIIKPLAVMLTMGALGYTKRVSFKVGVNLSQISEFSIIMVVLAIGSKVISPEIGTIITIVAIITIASSTYLMLYDDEIFNRILLPLKLRLFEQGITRKEKKQNATNQILLFGYHDGGHEFVKTFEIIKKKFLIIDYDPTVIEYLENNKLPCLYGDATDSELLNELNLSHVELVISTFGDFESSKQLITNCQRLSPDASLICQANNQAEALQLYNLGATYVVVSHHIGNERVSSFIKNNGFKKSAFNKHKEKHLTHLLDNSKINIHK